MKKRCNTLDARRNVCVKAISTMIHYQRSQSRPRKSMKTIAVTDSDLRYSLAGRHRNPPPPRQLHPGGEAENGRRRQGETSSLLPFSSSPFPPSAWHDGFARYDFVMDEQTPAINAFKSPEGEKFGVKDPPKGTRRCIVVVPKEAAPGNPWSWRGCYWDHQPQTEIELLKRGFHVAFISASATLRPASIGTPGTRSSPRSMACRKNRPSSA